MIKKKILINWDYSRKDLMQPFFEISNELEFIFIFQYNFAEDINKGFQFKIIYWNDFSSPYDIINEINPDKIVFHDIESFHQVALCIAAKNRGIPTFVLEHGIKFSLKSVLKGNEIHPPEETKTLAVFTEKTQSQGSSLMFYLKAIRPKNILQLPQLLLFLYFRKHFGILDGLRRCTFKLRTADIYINFTKNNFQYIAERDKLKPDQLISIGNPFFDQYFRSVNPKKEPDETPFYLYIDSPFVEDTAILMNKDRVIKCYNKLNEFCIQHHSKLKIKLHPRSYNSDYFPIHSNIEYLRDCNVIDEIVNAQGCFFAHFSTLAPLAMCYTSSVLLNALPAYNTDLTDLKIIPSYNFDHFKAEDIHFNELTPGMKEKLIQMYLYSTDGKSTERLKNILLS